MCVMCVQLRQSGSWAAQTHACRLDTGPIMIIMIVSSDDDKGTGHPKWHEVPRKYFYKGPALCKTHLKLMKNSLGIPLSALIISGCKINIKKYIDLILRFITH